MQSSSRAGAELYKFDQEEHIGNALEAFQEFVDAYHYEYDAIAKEPPKELATEALKTAWIQQNKRKLFLGRFASRNLQLAFEQVTSEEERSTATFTDMVTKLKAHFKTGSNTTLANYEFHKLSQKSGESFDAWAIRVKQESKNCDFSCAHDDCTVSNTLCRDRIVAGGISREISKHALKNEWGLDDIIKNGRQLEAAATGIRKMKGSPGSVRRVGNKRGKGKRRPGKYSGKKDQQFEKAPAPKQCVSCSSKACPGGKKCPGTKIECFDCGKRGHFRGASLCKKPKPMTRRTAESETDDSTTSDTENSDESGSTSEEAESTDSETTKRSLRLSAKHVTKIRRMRVSRPVRRSGHAKRYEVDVVIKETPVKAFADTGADICIMSKKKAKKIGLKLRKTRTSIRPYGSKKMKCCGYSIATVMHKDQVANVGIYIINKNVETLLSGAVAEELGIIT